MSESIRPVHYDLAIDPDLEQFRFRGRVIIDLELDRDVDRIELNLLELAVWRCRISSDHGWRNCAFSIDPEKETLSVKLPEQRNGALQLELTYDGKINDKMAGFYRSGYEQEGQVRFIAVTQFQESSARQAFPCMDHPRHKATFDLTMTVPAGHQAIANTPIIEETRVSGGRRTVKFERTPVMSTYLLFFGLGAFEFFEDEADPRVRVAALPGREDTVGLGLSFGRKALQFCETYYGIDYPLAKMDLIAVPDFAFGAMENWGAITFRENLLLFFPETTSAEAVERICEVIAHEIAHQWFGNLVTPSDWKYLWLNESFATYFGFGVVAEIHPDWGTWDQFLHSQTGTALVRDGLAATFPIEIPGGEHVVINSSTAPIIYNKGASMLRMIEGYIGPNRYRKGVQTYLSNHTYACAQSRHLWEAFEAASDAPVTAMVQNWIGQPGYPLIIAHRDGGRLNLTQQRFNYLCREFDQEWMVPIVMTYWTDSGDQKEQSFLLEGCAQGIDLPQDAALFKLNAGQTGFYRVYYMDDENLTALGGRMLDGALSHADRWGLQNDLYALARSKLVSLDRYLDYLSYYAGETDYLPLVSIASNLQQAYNAMAGQQRKRIADTGRKMAERVLDDIGLAPVAEETHLRAALRNQLLWLAVAWGGNDATTFALEQFDRMKTGRKVHPDIARSVMQAGAFKAGETALKWFQRRFVESPSEHERINILAGMAAFNQWALVEEALAFALDAVPPRNRFIPIAAAGGNPAAAPYLWQWYQSNLEALEAFHPLLYERVITGIVPYGGLGNEVQVKAFFNDYLMNQPQLTDVVALGLEYLEINSRMRGANTEG